MHCLVGGSAGANVMRIIAPPLHPGPGRKRSSWRAVRAMTTLMPRMATTSMDAPVGTGRSRQVLRRLRLCASAIRGSTGSWTWRPSEVICSQGCRSQQHRAHGPGHDGEPTGPSWCGTDRRRGHDSLGGEPGRPSRSECAADASCAASFLNTVLGAQALAPGDELRVRHDLHVGVDPHAPVAVGMDCPCLVRLA